MQTSFQEYSILGKSRPLVLNSPSTNDVRNTYLQPNQTSEINQADRLVGENYNLKRLHSPYLSPSHLAVEQIVLSQNIAPVGQNMTPVMIAACYGHEAVVDGHDLAQEKTYDVEYRM